MANAFKGLDPKPYSRDAPWNDAAGRPMTPLELATAQGLVGKWLVCRGAAAPGPCACDRHAKRPRPVSDIPPHNYEGLDGVCGHCPCPPNHPVHTVPLVDQLDGVDRINGEREDLAA